MIEKLRIQGLKCIDDASFELGNLTLFTGLNSAGKSTAIQAILMVIQSILDPLSPPLKGKYITLGEFKEIKNNITGAKKVNITFEFSNKEPLPLTTSIYYNHDKESVAVEHNDDSDDSGVEYIWDVITNHQVKIVYISADRIGVQDLYSKSYSVNEGVGVKTEFAFDYLSRNKYNSLKEDFIKDESEGVNLGNQVDFWLDYILGYTVNAEDIEGTDAVRVSYTNKGLNRPIRPRNVGTGVTYIANILISAFSCRKNDMLIIENPEIHLHPSAQSRLAEFLGFLSGKGVKILVETHSDHVFNGVRKAVRRQDIDTNDLSIYFFRQNIECICEPIKIVLREDGSISNHTKGLFDQFDEDLDELLGL